MKQSSCRESTAFSFSSKRLIILIGQKFPLAQLFDNVLLFIYHDIKVMVR